MTDPASDSVWVVEIEEPGEWSSVSSVHKTEAGALAAKAKAPLGRSQRAHVTEWAVSE